MIKTRFAPSPTGYLHLGGVRTALYSWLYARQNQGKFILRIEDTDVKRSTKKYLHNILESLKWLGLDWDEEIYFQSQRNKIYQEYIQKLINSGAAYYCYCTSEEIKRQRGESLRKGKDPGYSGKCRNLSVLEIEKLKTSNAPKVVRFKIPQGATELYDLVRGKISFQNDTFSDFIIMKSDGIPTYNFAVVVDDALMEITHVIRGDDHISNTPRQIMLFKALEFKLPKFIHLPMILGSDKKRLSKRHGATAITYFKKEGYLPQTLINYLSLLGWSTSDSQQILSQEELLKKFSLKGISKNPAIFDYDKMLWMNGQYIRKLSLEEFTKICIDYLRKVKIYFPEKDKWFREVVALYQSRIRVINELPSQAYYLFEEDVKIEKEASEGYLDCEKTIEILREVQKAISLIVNFIPKEIEKTIRELILKLKITAKEIIHPLRVAITGSTASPGIFEVVYLLGKEKVLRRIEKVINSNWKTESGERR